MGSCESLCTHSFSPYLLVHYKIPWKFWFGSVATSVHAYSFLLYKIETLPVQSTPLLKVDFRAVAEASLPGHFHSWLYRLLRSRLKNVGVLVRGTKHPLTHDLNMLQQLTQKVHFRRASTEAQYRAVDGKRSRNFSFNSST